MRGVAIVFFVAVLYLIVADGLAPWIALPQLDSVGFTLVFVVFALAHCWAAYGARRTLVFFLAAAIISYALEEAGVHTGAIYGPYHYGDMLGWKIDRVPVLIPLAWFMMIYPSWIVARAILRGAAVDSPVGIVLQALVAALIMSAWDSVMDPGMAAAGNWVWEAGGPYFGVPLRNYAGWVLTTFLVYCVAGVLWRGGGRRAPQVDAGFAALPVIIYAAYALAYVTPKHLPALQIVALFAMGTPALIALARIGLPTASRTI
ncbi:MAG: carotenoid biosynthesis protein [Vulcanimicrobiaceae bacterium]